MIVGAEAEPQSPAEQAWVAYNEPNEEAAQRLLDYKALRANAARALLAGRQEVVVQVQDREGRREAERKVAALSRLLVETDAEVARLSALFEAWWHSQQTKEADH